jgi:sugar phosphate isomerase/epimerase
MEIIFCKSKWEMWDDPLKEFVVRVATDGFEATELYLKPVTQSAAEVRTMHADHGLRLLGQILTDGTTPDDHLDSLDRQFDFAVRCDSFKVNMHAGRDIFSFSDNVRIFERGLELAAQAGITVVIETHRGRPTYSAVETRRYLDAMPDLRLTADFSHWMVVHESDLSDQEHTVRQAIDRSYHIHARVGYAEGPQITDPRAPEWARHVETHIQLWQAILDSRSGEGESLLTVTPEFGPPPYMHTLPFTEEPVADTWDINVYMRDLLRTSLRA